MGDRDEFGDESEIIDTTESLDSLDDSSYESFVDVDVFSTLDSVESIEDNLEFSDTPPETLSIDYVDSVMDSVEAAPEEFEDVDIEMLEVPDMESIGDSSEQIVDEIQEFEINYEEIYEGIQQETLAQAFEDIRIDADPEVLDESLQNFAESNWENLSLDEQKDSMSTLANYVVDVIGFENPPMIEYYNNAQVGDFGGYDASTNTLQVNEYMLYNSSEAADTIAHELWHAHQHERAMNPLCVRDYQYQYNFENYIPPALGQEAYESQLVEAEARAFAAQFKDRLSFINGRS